MKFAPYALCLVTLAAGCADVITGAPPAQDAAPTQDAARDATADAGGCTLPGGGVCALGATCPAGDGCNTCTCTASGLGCTLIGCVVPDAGPADAPSPDAAAGCQLPNGAFCPAGTTCPAGDGCNVCRCAPTGGTMCTTIGCTTPDAGPRPCQSRAQCNPWEDCLFPAPGCEVRGTCGSPRDCAAIVPYCGCNGETFRDCPGVTSQSYRAVGECPPAVDAGMGGRCDGAHIGRDGRSCVGPADNPLPLDCCTWNCDVRTAPCDSLPPPCAEGLVNTVVGCWGPCVPPSACMPMPCGEGNTCPSPAWRCNPMTRLCESAL